MAVTIAKLSTVSSLDSTGFSAGLKRMQSGIGAFSAVSLGAFTRIGSAVTNLVGRFAHAIPSMIAHSFKAGDALNELASQLGFDAGHLANLQRVAGLAGIELSHLESAIGFLNRALGEAMGGNKAAVKSFADLGLNFQQLAGQSPEQTLLDTLDALKKLETQAQKTSAARELFGRGGGGMLKLIGLGSAGINAQMQRTRGLGIAIEAADLSKLERASDAIDDLKNNLKGLGDQLAIKLAPHIESLAKSFLDWSVKVNAAFSAVSIAVDTFRLSLINAEIVARKFEIAASRGFTANWAVLRKILFGSTQLPWVQDSEKRLKELEQLKDRIENPPTNPVGGPPRPPLFGSGIGGNFPSRDMSGRGSSFGLTTQQMGYRLRSGMAMVENLDTRIMDQKRYIAALAAHGQRSTVYERAPDFSGIPKRARTLNQRVSAELPKWLAAHPGRDFEPFMGEDLSKAYYRIPGSKEQIDLLKRILGVLEEANDIAEASPRIGGVRR